jgi:DNA-binding MarR family transcriptional regulator
MNNDIPLIYDMVQDIAWHFGSHGINGECCGDLSFVEYMALKKACEANEITIQEIGSALNFTKSGATRIVNRLEQKGYVTRRHSPADGRICCIDVTAKGKTAVTEIAMKYIEYLNKSLKNLNEQKIKQIKDVLSLLADSIANNPE